MAANSKPLTSIYQRSINKENVFFSIFWKVTSLWIYLSNPLNHLSFLPSCYLFRQSILLIFPSLFFIHIIHPTHLSFFILHPSNPSYSAFLLYSSSIQSILLIFLLYSSSILLIFLLYSSSIQSILLNFPSLVFIHLIHPTHLSFFSLHPSNPSY